MPHRPNSATWIVGLACGIAATGLACAAWAQQGREGAVEEAPRRERAPVLAPVTVTATRTGEAGARVNRSSTVIDREEIEREGETFLGEVVRRVPSLRFQQLGGPGAFSSVSIRGARSTSQVLFLLDGFPLTDASAFSGGFDNFLGNIYLDDVDSVEVLRGPHTTLYGTDAVGGVVYLRTRRGEGPPGGSVAFEGGTRNTFKGAANLLGASDATDFSLTAVRVSSDGLDEHGDYEDVTLSARLGRQLNPWLYGSLLARTLDTTVDLNDQLVEPPFIDVDDPTNEKDASLVTLGMSLEATPRQWLFSRVAYSHNDSRAEFEDPVDPGEVTSPFTFLGSSQDGETDNLFTEAAISLGSVLGSDSPLWRDHTLSLGAEYEEQQFESTAQLLDLPDALADGRLDNHSVFLFDQIGLRDRLFFTAGVRNTDFERSGNQTTAEGAVALVFAETRTKLRASVASGFNDPGLPQLLDPQFGNPDLEAEEVVGYDAAVEQELVGGVLAVVVEYFHQRYTNLISFDPVSFRSLNIRQATAEGIETSLILRPVVNVEFRASYTFTDTQDEDPGNPTGLIPGVPEDRVGLSLTWRFRKKFVLFTDALYRGREFIGVFAPAAFNLNDPVWVVDASLTYEVTPRLSLYVRADNLFDEDYREDGLQAPGIFGFGGLRYRF